MAIGPRVRGGYTGGDLAAAPGPIRARTLVMPIDGDLPLPVRDCAPEQDLIPGSEPLVVHEVLGHLGLFAVSPTYMSQIDHHLGDLLATRV